MNQPGDRQAEADALDRAMHQGLLTDRQYKRWRAVFKKQHGPVSIDVLLQAGALDAKQAEHLTADDDLLHLSEASTWSTGPIMTAGPNGAEDLSLGGDSSLASPPQDVNWDSPLAGDPLGSLAPAGWLEPLAGNSDPAEANPNRSITLVVGPSSAESPPEVGSNAGTLMYPPGYGPMGQDSDEKSSNDGWPSSAFPRFSSGERAFASDSPAGSAGSSVKGIESWDSDPLMSDYERSLPRYQLEDQLGRGGQGTVWLAHDRQLNRSVALKEMRDFGRGNDAMRRRFVREAHLTAKLEHPGIVSVHDMGRRPSGQPFYTMRLVQGANLGEVIDRFHRTDPKPAYRSVEFNKLVSAIIDVAQAVGFAHQQGLIHRDLKPANVVLGSFGEALVVDWGMAKEFSHATNDGPVEKKFHSNIDSDRKLEQVLQEHSQRDSHGLVTNAKEPAKKGSTNDLEIEETKTGTAVGTPRYMAPEQALGLIDQLGPTTDVYALGTILYEMLVGTPAISGDSTSEVLEKVWNGDFRPPRQVCPSVPRALQAICLKAMAHEQPDRYGSATEFADDLLRWQAGEAVHAYPEPLWKKASRAVQRHPKISTAVVTASLLGFVMLWSVQSWRAQRYENATDHARQLLGQGEAAMSASAPEQALPKLAAADGVLNDLNDHSPLHEQIRQRLRQATQAVQTNLQHDLDRRLWDNFQLKYRDAIFQSYFNTGVDKKQQQKQALSKILSALDEYPKLRADWLRPGMELTVPPHLATLLKAQIRGNSTQETPGEKFSPPGNLSKAEQRQWRYHMVELHYALVAVLAYDAATNDADRENNALKALAVLQQTLAYTNPSAGYFQWKAKLLALDHQTAPARQALEKASSFPTYQWMDKVLLGIDASERQDFSHAKNWFAQALVENPDHFWSQYFLASCCWNLGEMDEAVIHWTACARQQPNWSWLYIRRGATWAQLGDAPQAQADFDRAKTLDPTNFALPLNLGRWAYRQHQYDKAIAYYQQALSYNKNSWQAYVNLAEVYRHQHDWKQAIEALEKAEQLAPRSSLIYRQWGRLAQERRKYDQAAQEFEKALTFSAKQGRQRARTLWDLAHAEYRLDKFADSLVHLAQAKKADPSFVLADLLSAYVFLARDRHQADLTSAEQAFSRFLDHHQQAGSAPESMMMGNALSMLEAVQVGSEDESPRTGGIMPLAQRVLGSAYRDRGLTRARLGQYESAMDDYSRAQQLMPGPAESLSPSEKNKYYLMQTRRGWGHVLQGSELAEKDFSRALKLNPASIDARIGRGFARAWSGQIDLSLDDVISIDGKIKGDKKADAQTLYNLSCVYAVLWMQYPQKISPLRDDVGNTSQREKKRRLSRAQIAQKALTYLKSALTKAPPDQRGPLAQIAQDDLAWRFWRDRDDFRQTLAPYLGKSTARE